MRAAGVKGLPGNKRARSKHQTPTASDLVDRKFTRDEPNKLWVTDIMEHPTREGKISCAVAEGYVFEASRWVVCRQLSDGDISDERSGNGHSNRGPTPGTLIHSDHGVQFTSWAFTRGAHDSGLVPSMGSIGDCYDSAVIESFWGRMQTELLNRKRWETRIELANAMFEYLEIFHNRQRRHSALGMLTPIEFENVHFTRQPVA